MKKAEKIEKINIPKNIINLDKKQWPPKYTPAPGVISAATFQLKINYKSLGKKVFETQNIFPPPWHALQFVLSHNDFF